MPPLRSAAPRAPARCMRRSGACPPAPYVARSAARPAWAAAPRRSRTRDGSRPRPHAGARR
eukprot:6089601-Prymnesium_polylepis.1